MINHDAINGRIRGRLANKPTTLNTEHMLLGTKDGTRLATADDKKAALSNICSKLGLVYQQNILFPDKIS
ncbi:MAG: hypothetical protein ACK5Z5_07835 [Neisseriaceae bacterium]